MLKKICRYTNLIFFFFKVPDCRNNPYLCNENASCKSTEILIKGDWILHTCQCNSGYFGNGIDCFADTEIDNYTGFVFWDNLI